MIFLAEGDHRSLDGVMVNTIAVDQYSAEDLDDESNQKYVRENPNNTEANQQLLSGVLLDEQGRFKLPKLKSADVVREIRNGAEFIQVGFVL